MFDWSDLAMLVDLQPVWWPRRITADLTELELFLSYCNLDSCWIYPRPYHWAERLAQQHRGVWHCQPCVRVIISLACALMVVSMVLSSHSRVVLMVWTINTLKPKKLGFPLVHNWDKQLEMLKRLVYHWNYYLSDFFEVLRLYLSSVSDIVLCSSLNQICIKTL